MNINKNQKVELLAPVADMKMLKSAINAGCDSIYIGGNKYGARAFAESTLDDNLLEYIKICHLFNKKIYLTVNTLIKNNEIDDFIKYTDFYYENGIDAFIVQDIGIAKLLIDRYKDLEIHASTQMNITSIESVKFLEKIGFNQVVLARELSLKEIKNIIDNVNVKIECFIHGSMCYSYSGCCYMSSFLGNNSGNRGRCKGPCRLCYNYKNNNAYFLSLKDMSTLEYIKELINIGVSSFKIEGRMRKDIYVASVVSQYREMIDDIYNNKAINKEKINKMEKIMQESYDKNGFTNYLSNHNSKQMIQFDERKHRNIDNQIISSIKELYIDKELIKLIDINISFKINQKIEAIIIKDNITYDLTIDIIPTEAKNKPITKEEILKQFSKNSNDYIRFNNINIDMDENIFLPISQINETRRIILSYDFSKHRKL